MGKIENLRLLSSSLEPDPNIKLEKVRDGEYKIKFDRGDTSKLPGKAWGRVITGVDPSKKGGYALQGKRWIHSGNLVKEGDIVAYNVAGSGKFGNMEDLYVSGIVDGRAYVLAWCNWSDKSEKQGMIEDLADILKSLDEGVNVEKMNEGKLSKDDIEAVKDTVRSMGKEKMQGQNVISDLLVYRTIGTIQNGCVTVKGEILEKLKLNEGDFVIVTIEIPP